MKLHKYLLIGAASLVLATTAKADFSVYITGSTAFRAAAYASIASLYNTGFNVNASAGTAAPFTTIANAQAPNRPTADSTFNGANAMTFSGTMPAFGSQVVTIYCSWTGSVEGIRDVTQGNSLPFLSTAVSQTSAFSDAGTTAVADFAFSDVFQSSTIYKTPTLQTLPCGVVPFVFVKNNGASGNLTNLTHQQAQTLFANGVVSLGQITGDTTTGTGSDTNKVLTLIGRYNGSGTRAAVFADTGYGALKTSFNYKFAATAGPGSTAIWTNQATPDVGYTGGSSIKTDLGNNCSQAVGADGTTAVTGYALGYLGVKDGYGVTGNSAGALMVSYNGQFFSTNAVQNGSYTLWSYEHFYNKSGIAAATLGTLKTNILNAIPANLGADTTIIGIPTSAMKVSRSVDGGPIATLY
ncbi:MAG: hypothetical protein EBS05_04655 [Proteobacteria bacterium]|nr:hypothetical protein [Pseudomonadota bacterium]